MGYHLREISVNSTQDIGRMQLLEWGFLTILHHKNHQFFTTRPVNRIICVFFF